jgi:uncharacterized protein (TIGR03435 family)
MAERILASVISMRNRPGGGVNVTNMNTQRIRTSVVFCLMAVAAIAAEGPAFEVASIKPAAPDARGIFIRNLPGGRVNVTNMSLKDLIVFAYKVQPFQVTGGPPWLDSARFDIVAKAEKPPAQGELFLMVQSLLAERFGLKLRRESKEMPVYALVSAKNGNKATPGLVEAKEGGCAVVNPSAIPPPPKPGEAPPKFCGGLLMGRGQVNGTAVSVSQLGPLLSRMLGRTVVDQTGMAGKFDIKLEWTPEETQQMFGGPPPLAGGDAPKSTAPEMAGPSIFTAIQEQMGLRLESQKGPVEMLIVENAEKPTEN